MPAKSLVLQGFLDRSSPRVLNPFMDAKQDAQILDFCITGLQIVDKGIRKGKQQVTLNFPVAGDTPKKVGAWHFLVLSRLDIGFIACQQNRATFKPGEDAANCNVFRSAPQAAMFALAVSVIHVNLLYRHKREAYSALTGRPSLQFVLTDPVSSVQAVRFIGAGGAVCRGIG